MSALAVLAAVGITTSLIGQWQAAESEREAAEMDAEFKRLKANELLSRTKFNNELIARESERVQGIQQVQAAASGFDVSTGASLLLLEETASLAKEQIITNAREAEFDANTLRTEADFQAAQARQIERARRISAIGQAIGSAASLGKSMPGTAGTSGLQTSSGRTTLLGSNTLAAPSVNNQTRRPGNFRNPVLTGDF